MFVAGVVDLGRMGLLRVIVVVVDDEEAAGGVGDLRKRGLRIMAGRVDGLEVVAMRHGGWRESGWIGAKRNYKGKPRRVENGGLGCFHHFDIDHMK